MAGSRDGEGGRRRRSLYTTIRSTDDDANELAEQQITTTPVVVIPSAGELKRGKGCSKGQPGDGIVALLLIDESAIDHNAREGVVLGDWHRHRVSHTERERNGSERRRRELNGRCLEIEMNGL